MAVKSTERRPGARRTEVESLISLLEDPDAYVHQQVVQRLLELGEGAIPLLDEFTSVNNDQELNEQVQDIIRTISYGSIEHEFITYLEGELKSYKDLETGVLILSRFDKPTIRIEHYMRKLDKLANEVRPLIRNVSQGQACKILMHYVFETKDFRGTSDDYFNPANSYIHSVLERHEGIPISLAMLVLFLAQRLDLPVEGVNMPMHFLLRYSGGSGYTYVDPFNSGVEVSVDQCSYFLKKSGIQPSDSHFNAASSAEMLARTLRNLINSHEKKHDTESAKELKKLLEMVEVSQLDLK